jgi:hypothetical protein
VIVYWDGTAWEPVAAPTIPGGITPTGHTTGVLKSVFFAAPDDGWAVGFPGKLVATILHWDGFSWQHVNLSPALLGQIPPILTSVYMTSETNGWIVGGSPDFNSCKTTTAACYFNQTAPIGRYGYKTPLSTMLRFSPFGGTYATTVTSTIVSTVSTQTTALTTTYSSITNMTCPQNVTATIKVVDNQQNPVSGADVTLTPASFSTCLPGSIQGVTNAQGVVTFTLPAGTYSVTISKNGVTSTYTINITSSGQVFSLGLNITQGTGLIPGFPFESILAGLIAGVGTLVLLRRRRRVQ